MKPDSASPGQRRSEYSSGLYAVFVLLALVACLGLDFLAARKGEPAYVFGFLSPKKEPHRPAPLSLTDAVLDELDQSGVPAERIHKLRDETGAPRLDISLSEESYEKIQGQIAGRLKKAHLSVEIEKKEDTEKTIYLWQVARTGRDRLSIAFFCPRPPAAETAGKAPSPPPPPAGDTAAIIIDDMGNSLEALNEILALNIPLTISVLPFSPYAQETARIAHEHGLEVMLHLPGESLNNTEDYAAEEWMIRSEMSENEIRDLVKKSLETVPYASGVNNHMGSRITQQESVMRPLLETIGEHRLFFVDSRTTDRSIAYDLAMEMGIPVARRHVFLDSTVGRDFSRQKIVELLRLSQTKGKAVAIGHPFPETLCALRENVELFEKFEVRPVFASQMVSIPASDSNSRRE